MDNIEVTGRVILFFSLLLAYCAANTLKPAENDILGMKFTGPDHKKWQFGIGLLQVIGAMVFYAWTNYHAHANLENFSWVIQEHAYVIIVIVCAASLVTGIVNVIRGMDTQRLGHL